MKIRSLLSTCSTTTSYASPLPTFPYSDPTSDIQTQSSSSSSSATSSNTSIQTNLSLLTLPSVPSLQKLSLSPDQDSSTATSFLLTSLKPHHRPSAAAHVNYLTLHNHLLYAATGNQINVYETITNTLFDTFNSEKPTSGSVKSISFSAGKIFTGHQDCKIRVWKLNYDLKRHKLLATLPTLEDRLLRFVLPHNYVKVRRHKKKLWIEHHDAVSALATHQTFLISVSWDRTIKVWETQKPKCLQSVAGAHDDAINAAVVSKDGVIYTGSADKRIKLWRKDEDSEKYEVIATLEKHKSAVNALALSLDGSVLFSGSCDRSILVWEREDSANHMAVTGALRGHAKAILCLINAQDLLMSGSADRTVRMWRRGVDGRFCCLAVLEGHQAPVRSLAAAEGCNGGVKVFSGSFDGEIRVWQVEVSSVKNNNYNKTISQISL